MSRTTARVWRMVVSWSVAPCRAVHRSVGVGCTRGAMGPLAQCGRPAHVLGVRSDRTSLRSSKAADLH